jgi:hypothetical protein
MMWAKLDSGWFDHHKFDAAARDAPRADVLAAWAVLVAWTVRARSDGRLTRDKATRVVEMAVEPSASPATVVDALVSAGLLRLIADTGGALELSGWHDWQLSRAEQDEAREAASERQRRRRYGVGEGSHVTRDKPTTVTRDSHASVTRDSHSTVTRESREAVTRESRNRQDKKRQEETRQEESRADARERAHESAALVVPSIRDEAQTVTPSPLPPRQETTRPVPPTPPTLSPGASAILAELGRHGRLDAIATPDMAQTLEGRRIATGRPLPHVLSAIGDCAAKAVEGTQAQALRSMLVGFCDRAGTGPKARAPVAQSAPVERAWSVGEVRVEVPA